MQTQILVGIEFFFSLYCCLPISWLFWVTRHFCWWFFSLNFFEFISLAHSRLKTIHFFVLLLLYPPAFKCTQMNIFDLNNYLNFALETYDFILSLSQTLVLLLLLQIRDTLQLPRICRRFSPRYAGLIFTVAVVVAVVVIRRFFFYSVFKILLFYPCSLHYIAVPPFLQ